MGTLANSLFQAMLGWIRTLSSQIWTTATSSESTTLLSWIGEHWIVLTIVLCAVGVILDLIVYLIRWQPWRAWRSFFRRIRHRREAGEADEREEMIPDAPEAEYLPAENPYAPPRMRGGAEATLAEDASAGSRRAAGRDEQSAWQEEYAEDDPEEPVFEADDPLRWGRNEPEGTTAAFEQALRPRKRRRVSNLFAEKGEDTVPPDQLIDQYAAYRRPVYPRGWQADEGEEE